MGKNNSFAASLAEDYSDRGFGTLKDNTTVTSLDNTTDVSFDSIDSEDESHAVGITVYVNGDEAASLKYDDDKFSEDLFLLVTDSLNV